MCHYVCVMMHIKDPQLSVVRVGHRVPFIGGFCLSLYGLHVLNRDVNMIQSINQSINQFLPLITATTLRMGQWMICVKRMYDWWLVHLNSLFTSVCIGVRIRKHTFYNHWDVNVSSYTLKIKCVKRNIYFSLNWIFLGVGLFIIFATTLNL